MFAVIASRQRKVTVEPMSHRSQHFFPPGVWFLACTVAL